MNVNYCFAHIGNDISKKWDPQVCRRRASE
jgi:hypothetical protein